ncbi:TonB-dependent receptor [Paracoccus sp. (in: a-proteobacteria)]|uniref:TonB-dependent receptor domain-containing protein n=1 Tax=Paracoccus sp. TaxID=267 RepID=UPI0026E07854|nr:TonB-dependent receptor [Paracoccus sp. (in: a-proteobacteria)]MDO5647164.1 TonB-dependent receptor [Paracoccus sp. (in: a-proteobacteria)]
MTRTLTALFCTVALPAFAQTVTVSGQPYLLDQIVLRAGTEKVAAQVPQSVSVVGNAELRDIAPAHIGQVLDQVPGVAGVGSGSFFGQAFNIRGFGSGMAASETGIVQILDGEKKYYESYRQGSLFVEPEFLKRVEVLRGPGSSTLYGSGALGGVIAMDTIDPGDLIADGARSGGRVKLGYGSNPQTAYGSIAWGWRPSVDFEALAAFALRQNGDLTDADGATLVRTDSRVPNVLFKAQQRIGDHQIKASYQQLEARGDNQDFNQLDGPQAGLFPGFPGWGVGDIVTRDRTARLEWGHNPENPLVDATVTLSYTSTLKDIRQGDDPAEPIMASLLGRRDYALWTLRGQNVADLSGAGYSHFVTAGAQMSWQDRTSSVPSSSHPEAKTATAALFAFSEFERGPLTVNTGLRVERQRTRPADSVTYSDDVVRADSFEPQIAAIYRLSDDWSVFGSAAMVNRMPNVDELYDGFRGAAPSPDLKTEKGRNLEIGLSWRGQNVARDGDEGAVKLTLFRNHISDMIVRTNGRAPVPAYTNLDRAYLRGGEIEASYLTGAIELGAALSYVTGKDQDGTVLDSLPNNRAVLSAAWQATDEWRFGARSTLAAGRTKADGNRRAGYGVHDIFATWTPQTGPARGMALQLGVDNVTNRDYTPATYQSGPAAGRNVKIALSRSF